MLTARVDRDLLAAFDALAEGRGGRSALLRSILQQALKQVADAPRIAPRADPAGNRVSLTFTSAEAAVLDHRAAERGVDRAGWIKALVRRHIALKGTVDDGMRDAIAPIRMQLQRIGRNLNQAMKAGNAAMMADSGLQIELELRRIADMREEINGQIAALAEVLRGETAFWQVAD
ncbi:hypothetical protein GO308_17865 [Sphingomonas sp. SFZ2018-12]|uniref:hypothetical protein n=1 Tax=Sphingomonas sp. SFZ2018-12 TaxID=2683197 RepID=UPI001F0DFADA|nr:hypothetical protein [Sphingomonas sp. SFZ2018-12]MCH4894973.1 hypothetical protein [Sphingomonas sp. SFZ2018-12]